MKYLLLTMVLARLLSGPFQYQIVQTLKKKGIRSSHFMFLPSDIKNYRKLIASTDSYSERKQMEINYYAFIIPFWTGIGCFFLAILTGLFF